jgi:hypothetical protein
MRLSATVLLVACCAASLAGCCGRGHRHGCLFGDRVRRDACVDRDEWDDDDDGHACCPCGCHGGPMRADYSMSMPAFDAGCGCGAGMSMPAYYGGMPMSYDSFAQPGGCGCGAGGMMSMPMMSAPATPTFDQPIMMHTPTLAPTPTPAAPPSAPAAESYYTPNGGNAPAATSATIPPKY